MISRPRGRLVVRRGRLAEGRSGSEAAASARPRAVPNAIGPAIGPGVFRPASGIGRGLPSQTPVVGGVAPRPPGASVVPGAVGPLSPLGVLALVGALLLAAALPSLPLPLPAFLAFLPLELLRRGRGGRVGGHVVELLGGWGFVLPFGSALGGGAAMASRKAETFAMMSAVTSLKVRR